MQWNTWGENIASKLATAIQNKDLDTVRDASVKLFCIAHVEC